MKGTCRLAEAEEVRKSDEGKRDSWRSATETEQKRDTERKEERQSARSSFHTSNEVTQHRRAGWGNSR